MTVKQEQSCLPDLRLPFSKSVRKVKFVVYDTLLWKSKPINTTRSAAKAVNVGLSSGTGGGTPVERWQTGGSSHARQVQ